MADGHDRYGVTATAFMVAAARAIETTRIDTLAQDPYAEHFVRASARCADWPVRIEDVPDGDDDPLWGRLGRYFGLRTRVFDDFLLTAARSGIRQVVLLGAGLDTRAMRLGWPDGCVVYELDLDHVLRFKHEVLGRQLTIPAAKRVPIPVDLRDDWAGALVSAGFDPSRPTVWLAEGLLLYLRGDAENRLVDTVNLLSAAGSRFAYEVKLAWENPDNPVYREARRQIGVDLLALFDTEPRPDSAGALSRHGWAASCHTPFDFTRVHGKGPLPEAADALAGNRWVFAMKRR